MVDWTSFSNQTLLLTGGTGFLGKLILEKALNANVNLILLVRPKDKPPLQRIQVCLQSPIFVPLRTKLAGDGHNILSLPKFMEWVLARVTVVTGDLRQPSLGINQEHLIQIYNRVDVLIHCGAITTDFSKRGGTTGIRDGTSRKSVGVGSGNINDEPIDAALQTNIIGSEEMLRIAKKITNLKAFFFISTAFSQKMKGKPSDNRTFWNSKNSSISDNSLNIFTEKLPPLDFDVYKVVKRMDTRTHQSQKIIHTIKQSYPNTHAFTKSLAEQILVANNSHYAHNNNTNNNTNNNNNNNNNNNTNNDNNTSSYNNDDNNSNAAAVKEKPVQLVFMRPGMIGCTYKDPFPGWTENLCGCGSLLLWVGLGMVSVIPGDPNNIVDVIPADFVVNHIFAVWALIDEHKKQQRQQQLPNPLIFHCTSSSTNPVRWGYVNRTAASYWTRRPPSRAVVLPPSSNVTMVPSQFPYSYFYTFQKIIKDEVPNMAYKTVARAVRSPLHLQQSKTVNQLVRRSNTVISNGLLPYLTHEWVFSVENSDSFLEKFKENFEFSSKSIDWHTYLSYYCYGIQKYILKEDHVSLPSDKELEFSRTGHKILPSYFNHNRRHVRQDPHDHSILFDDVRFALFMNRNIFFPNSSAVSQRKIHASVLTSPRVASAISQTVKLNPELSESDLKKETAAVLSVMEARMNIPTIRTLGYFFRKVWKKLYHNIYVNSDGIEKIREIQHALLTNQQHKQPIRTSIVYVPSHRSYIDFLMMSYILWEYSLALPHIAAGEDFLGISYVCELLRAGGAFFLKRSFKGDVLYTALFSEYVQQLISIGCPLEFFIEGTRSRSGKSLQPKYGLLGMITESFFAGRVDDIFFIPVHINYEKVVEGELYAREMLGRPKPRESLQGLLEARSILRQDYGRIGVKIGEPISLRDYVEENNGALNKNPGVSNSKYTEEFCRKITIKLAHTLVYQITEKTMWSPISLVSSILLTYRFGISRKELVDHVEWLQFQMLEKQRGCIDWIRRPSQSIPSSFSSSSSSSSFSSSPSSSSFSSSPSSSSSSSSSPSSVEEEYEREYTSPSAIVSIALKQLSNIVFTRVSPLVLNASSPPPSSSSSSLLSSSFYNNSQNNSNNNNNNINNNNNKNNDNHIIRPDEDTESFILLGFYRNRIIHLFFSESVLMCALYGLSCSVFKSSTAPRDQVISEAAFLWELLSEEVVNNPDITSSEAVPITLHKLVQEGVLKEVEINPSVPSVEILSTSSILPFPALFYCSLLWPFIESYWITSVILTKALNDPKNSITKQVIIERCLWFSQNQINQGKCLTAESSSKENFANSIIGFKKLGVISENNDSIFVTNGDTTKLTFLEKRINDLRRPVMTPNTTATTDKTTCAKL